MSLNSGNPRFLQHLKAYYDNRKITRETRFHDYFSWGRDQRHVRRSVKPNELRQVAVEKLRAIRSRFFFEKSWKELVERYESFEKSYLLLSDESSRSLFVQLLLMNFLGEHRYSISRFDKEFIKNYERASQLLLNSGDYFYVGKWRVARTFFKGLGIWAYTGPEILNCYNLNRLYRYDPAQIGVRPGDVVIDGGMGLSDTTVIFGASAGVAGKVYGFDLQPANSQLLTMQLSMNPSLKNVETIIGALSDVDGELVSMEEHSTSSRVSKEGGIDTVKTISLDKFVERRSIAKVDFIKLDIEGAELPALRGAASTIARFKPQLAICVYHKWDDLREIPCLLAEMREDYKFYLDCTTGFGGEAVLYAR
jgi:FkbM family methyltransferase